MNIEEMAALLRTEAYDFLRTDEHLGKNICLLTLGGSHAYGTDIETSDVDFRGIAVNPPQEILLGRDFEQVSEWQTDTVIYSINKIFGLLEACNPNTIEMLGCKPEHYFMLNDLGKLLMGNSGIFLSQRASVSFAGYANQQLRRLENHSSRYAEQPRNEEHILRTIENQTQEFRRKYASYDCHDFRLYIDKTDREGMEVEIYVDADIKHYPVRDFKGLWRDMYNIVNSYNTLGSRNSKAFNKNKINKHMMHLVRLYYMAFDILENKQIVTYREKEHELLMSIRNKAFLNGDGQPTEEFYGLVDDLEKRFLYAQKNTDLPEEPDKRRIDELQMEINRAVLAAIG